MLLFFRNIPANTRTSDFHKLIKPAMGNAVFSAFNKGRIVNVKIVRLLDSNTKILEYHGLVRIEPDKVAQKVIKRLNRKSFKGVRINVREYRSRSWHNDRRTKMSNTLKSASLRKKDRRRRDIEVVEDINQQFSSTSSFHRIH